MEDEVKTMLEEAIRDGFNGLKKTEAGSEQHSKQTEDICKLYGMKLKEDELSDENTAKAMQRGADSEKLERECELKRVEFGLTQQRALLDIGKAIILIAANGCWMRGIMKFEETGSITTKAFGLVPKLKLF